MRAVTPTALLSLTGVPAYLAIGLINTKRPLLLAYAMMRMMMGGVARHRVSHVFLSEPVFVFTFSPHPIVDNQSINLLFKV